MNALALSSADTDRSERLKDQWLATLNHEIRTPLAGIVGMIDLLLETKLDGDQKEYIVAARQCAESLLGSLNGMLEYSSLSAGRAQTEEVEFHLGAMLEDAMDEYRTHAAAKGIGLSYQPHAGMGRFIVCDQVRLRQIFRHVMNNAIKFTSIGEIEVKARHLEEHGHEVLSISIRDTGIGIAPQNLERIFESFEQLESGLSRSYSGLGLGLALAKKLAVLLGGDVEAQSELNRGSEFRFWVKVRTVGETPSWLAGRDHTPRARRILVVEDNKLSQRIVSHVLQRRRYEVDCVNDGLEAIQAFREREYGLVLMDLQLPGMDGLETSDQIRRLPAGFGVPILAVTANTSDEYRARCLSAGMCEFLSKPIQPDELLNTVARHLP